MAKRLMSRFLRRFNGTHPKRKKYKLPKAVAADKAYDQLPIRSWLRKKAIKDIIPLISSKPEMDRGKYFSQKVYKKRIVIEHCFGRMKEKKGVGS